MILQTQIDTQSPDFKKNKVSILSQVTEWRRRIELAKLGGGEEALKKHKARGKLTARERIEGLLDPGTAFLEFSTLAAADMYEGQAPGGGVVTGIGVIENTECIVVANDARSEEHTSELQSR